MSCFASHFSNKYLFLTRTCSKWDFMWRRRHPTSIGNPRKCNPEMSNLSSGIHRVLSQNVKIWRLPFRERITQKKRCTRSWVLKCGRIESHGRWIFFFKKITLGGAFERDFGPGEQEFKGTNFQKFKYPWAGKLKFRLECRTSMKFASVPNLAHSNWISPLKEASTTFKPHKRGFTSRVHRKRTIHPLEAMDLRELTFKNTPVPFVLLKLLSWKRTKW